MPKAFHAVLGDEVYGGFRTYTKNFPADLARELKECAGQLLHAGFLGFEHPRSGKRLEIESPPPEEFERILAALLW